MSRVFLVTVHLYLLKQRLSLNLILAGGSMSSRDPHLSLLPSAGSTVMYNHAWVLGIGAPVLMPAQRVVAD